MIIRKKSEAIQDDKPKKPQDSHEDFWAKKCAKEPGYSGCKIYDL
ncbi:MAG: hypothetical protein ACO24P_00125 [Candidatus Nanopelagicaceae bacterium]